MPNTDLSIDAALEDAINRYLALDPEAPEKLQPFSGKIICIEITGMALTLLLTIEKDRIRVSTDNTGAVADATLRGSVIALIKMGMQRDVADLLLQGEIEIIGDMRLGRAFKAFLAGMKIDWEEQLSKTSGDVVAHELMKTARKFVGWGRNTTRSLAQDVSEYVQEESRDVVSGAELDGFYQQVDELRMAADRFQARMEHYKNSKAEQD